MRKELKLIIVIICITTYLVGCGQGSVKYISTEADDIDSATEETVSTDVDIEELGANTEQADIGDTVPVYVCGAVNNPGVYYLSPNSLKADALHMAGGLTSDAALDYVNLAETVNAGEKIYFPYADEVADSVNISQSDNDQGNSGKININTATKDELMTLPGIGDSKADAIIKYRDEYGPFQNIEDITNITGIKEGVYNNIKDYIIAD